MKPLAYLTVLLIGAAALVPAAAGDKDNDRFVPMFNGKDITGWVPVNVAPSTFYVKDNQIITTGRPIGFMRTAKQYENFIAEFDWMHVPPTPKAEGNSGFFVWADPIPVIGSPFTRGIEVQVLVNLTYRDKQGNITASSHGDIFSIWGAKCVPDRPHPQGAERCLPSENRAKGANEWNHYRVEANNGRITLAVNGKVVSGVSKCTPRKGYLALESEGSECRFKNLKIKELPSTNPRPDEIAKVDEGFRNMYTGLDLTGWKVDEQTKKSWHPRDMVLHADGKTELVSAKAYGDAEFIIDCRFPNAKSEPCTFLLRGRDGVKVTLLPSGKVSASTTGANGYSEGTIVKGPGNWNRLRIQTKGSAVQIAVNNSDPIVRLNDSRLPQSGDFAISPGSAMDVANLFVRELK
jgi:hypothetical protein